MFQLILLLINAFEFAIDLEFSQIIIDYIILHLNVGTVLKSKLDPLRSNFVND
jgi:hypothetical protein